MKTILVAVAIAAAVCSSAAWGQGFGGPGGRGGAAMSCPAMAVRVPPAAAVDQLGRALQLSAAQKTKLKGILSANDKKIRSLEQSASKACQALHQSLLSAKYDSKTSKDLAIKAQKAEAAVVSARIDEWTQIRSILTAKQAASLRTMGARRFGPAAPGAQPPPG